MTLWKGRIATGLAETFFTYAKLGAFGGICLAFPVIAAQLWMFVAPGLYKHERNAFLPFLLAFGPAGAVASMILLYALLVWSVRRLRVSVSLFSLLIFLRVAYVCLMSPFAPQAFIWTNAVFIVLCLFMQLFAALLPSRRDGVAIPPPSESMHGTR